MALGLSLDPCKVSCASPVSRGARTGSARFRPRGTQTIRLRVAVDDAHLMTEGTAIVGC